MLKNKETAPWDADGDGKLDMSELAAIVGIQRPNLGNIRECTDVMNVAESKLK